MNYTLRDFNPADKHAVNGLALAAFQQFQEKYSDWKSFSRHIGEMASLSTSGELIVAVDGDSVVGAVVYVGPYLPKSEYFSVEWSIIRMLVVDPGYRGQGVGRALTEECVARAQRDGASVIALHTSPIMEVALPMYQRMGFMFEREVPPIYGVRYSIYLKKLGKESTQ